MLNPLNTNLASITVNGIPFQEGTNTILGINKQNPYTVSNMNDAWQSLFQNGVISNTETSVRTTHYYVKFKPTNLYQYEALQNDTSLALSDFPIENNITQNGDYYHDPTLPANVPTYQYTAVKADYHFPDSIPYEIIDNLYIPEADQILQYENGGTNDFFVDKLLNQAYTQTGNFQDTIDLSNAALTLLRKYTPGGNIQVFDTRTNSNIGMEGVKVQARRWFIVYYANPSFNGDYRMAHSFKRPCNYSIWFNRPKFEVREHFFELNFWINGPKITGDWNYTLNNSYQQFAGHVFRGAYRYHYKDIGGLHTPSAVKMAYVAKNGSKDPVNPIVLNYVWIYRYNNTRELYSDEVFSNTVHETAHTSHSERMSSTIQYWRVDRLLQESWAIAVEWYLTHIEYVDRGIANYGDFNYFPINPPGYPNSYAYQYWAPGPNRKENWYTGLYIDIVDDYNQLGHNFPPIGTSLVDDQVHGYTIPQIEGMLLNIYNSGSLRDQLKANKPVGVTDTQIDLLVNY